MIKKIRAYYPPSPMISIFAIPPTKGKNHLFLRLFLGDSRQDFTPLAITLLVPPKTGEFWAILSLMEGGVKYPQYPPKKGILGHLEGIRWLFYRLLLF
jgi:hypothetical protein